MPPSGSQRLQGLHPSATAWTGVRTNTTLPLEGRLEGQVGRQNIEVERTQYKKWPFARGSRVRTAVQRDSSVRNSGGDGSRQRSSMIGVVIGVVFRAEAMKSGGVEIADDDEGVSFSMDNKAFFSEETICG